VSFSFGPWEPEFKAMAKIPLSVSDAKFYT